MGNTVSGCFTHTGTALPPASPGSSQMTLQELQEVCVDGDLIFCRESVYNANMMININPVMVNGVNAASIAGNYSTKRRGLPAWTSYNDQPNKLLTPTILDASRDSIRLTSLESKIKTLKTSPANKYAVRRLKHPNDEILPALQNTLNRIRSITPITWVQAKACTDPELSQIFQRLFFLLRSNIVALTPPEIDMVRYAFNKHDAECLGWLFIDDLEKVGHELDDMELFKNVPTWLDEVHKTLTVDAGSKFTADDLIAAVRTIPRRHISPEYDIALHTSAALVASIYDSVELLSDDLTTKPLVPAVFDESSGPDSVLLRPERGDLGKTIYLVASQDSYKSHEHVTWFQLFQSWQHQAT
ncbi:hypothetical protein AC1031_021534 [Aphanomyces cochlioides]|nr:hypothetical protein AC1031_021534 [Aphanomyces cochlioides]